MEQNSNINDEFRFKAETLDLHAKKKQEDNRGGEQENLDEEEKSELGEQDKRREEERRVQVEQEKEEQLQRQEEYKAEQSSQAESVSREGRFK